MIDEQGAVKVTSLQVYLEKKRNPDLPAMCGLHKVYKVYYIYTGYYKRRANKL